MDIQHLRCFVESARCGNIQNAADFLHVSRQAVSKMLSAMENEIGYPLLLRIHGGVILTEEGRRYYNQALALVQSFDNLASQMVSRNEKVRLQVAVPFTLHNYFYERMQAFEQAHKNEVELKVIGRTDAECQTLFDNHAVDVSISNFRLSNSSEKDNRFLIARSQIHIIMRLDCPLSRKPFITPEDLAKSPMLYYRDGYPECTWILKEPSQSALILDDIMYAYELVRQGKGLLPAPLISIPQFIKDLAIVPYKGRGDTDYFYCNINSRTSNNHHLRQLCHALCDAISDFPRKQDLS